MPRPPCSGSPRACPKTRSTPFSGRSTKPGSVEMDVSFFVQMGWKSALIAGAALGLAYVLRSRAASDRAMVLQIGVTMLLLLPPAALALPALQIEAFSAPEPQAPAPAAAPAIAPETASAYQYVPGPEAQLPAAQAAAPQPAAAPTI